MIFVYAKIQLCGLFHFPVQNPVSYAFHGGTVIEGLHGLNRAFEFSHQFVIKGTHAIGQFHAERLDARIFACVCHVFHTEVEKISPHLILVHLQFFRHVECQAAYRRVVC